MDNKPSGEDLAGLLLATIPHADRLTITEVGAHSVAFTWQGFELGREKPRVFSLSATSRDKDLFVQEYAKLTPMSRRPPCWSNGTDVCCMLRALLQQRWAIYGLQYTLPGLVLAGGEDERPDAKIIAFTA